MTKRIRFGLVLDQAEKKAVLRLAQAEGGLSQAAVMRRLLRLAADRHGHWPPDESQPNNQAQG